MISNIILNVCSITYAFMYLNTIRFLIEFINIVSLTLLIKRILFPGGYEENLLHFVEVCVIPLYFTILLTPACGQCVRSNKHMDNRVYLEGLTQEQVKWSVLRPSLLYQLPGDVILFLEIRICGFVSIMMEMIHGLVNVSVTLIHNMHCTCWPQKGHWLMVTPGMLMIYSFVVFPNLSFLLSQLGSITPSLIPFLTVMPSLYIHPQPQASSAFSRRFDYHLNRFVCL